MKGEKFMNCIKKFLEITCISVLIALIASSCSSKTTTNTETSEKVAEQKEVSLSNEIFKVSPDAKFDNMYTTKVATNYIEIYDLESISKGNPGLLFAICAFENPSEWAGGPHEKVGELKLNNGKLYDIIIGYPTESQFGFDNTEMPEKYKSMYDDRYNIASSVTGLNGEKISMGAGAKGENLYKEILEKHLTALKEDWDTDKYREENMSDMYSMIKSFNEDYLDKIAYAYFDINLDGIDELLIGEISDDKGIKYDMYTMVDRAPKHVVSGWDRNRFYAVDGGMISNEYSNGATESGVNVFVLDTNSTNLTHQISIKYDEAEDENNPWYVAYSGTNDNYNYEHIEETNYNELISRFSNHSSINYIPFSSLS